MYPLTTFWIENKVSCLKYFNITHLLSFCFQKSLGITYFPKEYLFRKKQVPGEIISSEIMTGE